MGLAYSVDCVKRNQTSVFLTSLIQSKHMLKRVASIYWKKTVALIHYESEIAYRRERMADGERRCN